MAHITTCRFCSSEKITPYLDLGFTPLADRFLTAGQLHEPERYYPLVVVLCEKCGLSQLDYTVDPKELYQDEYPYSMSLTQTGADHYAFFAQTVSKKFNLTNQDLVVDIGSNVGILLSGFKNYGTRVLGIDPAHNMAKIACANGIETIADFFTPEIVATAKEKYGPAKIILGTNVFAHIFDHHQFIEALAMLLQEDGVFIFESPSFIHLVKNLEYDTMYHEHLLYLSLKPVRQFFEKFNFDIIHVEAYPIHGGSFRVFVARKGIYEVDVSVEAYLADEEEAGIHTLSVLREFSKKVAENRENLRSFIAELKRNEKKLAIISAPAKGMTLLNYCGLGREYFDFVTEKSPLKIGRFTPGTHIPIVSDAELVLQKPDYALLLAWNFSDEIIKNLSEYKSIGGTFIIPIPVPRVDVTM